MTTALEDQTAHDFTPGRAGKVGALRDSASRLGEEVRQVAIERVVRPTLKAARHAGEVIEDRARLASGAVQESVSIIQEKALQHPRQTLGYAFAAGLLIGLLLPRR